MSLFCKGTKRLPRNFRIWASQAYRRRRLHSTCRWPAIGHGCWRLGHRSYERVCTLGHGYLGLHVEGIMPEALRDWGAGIGHWRRWRGIRGLTSPSAVYCAASGAANFAACGQLRGLRRVTKLARPFQPSRTSPARRRCAIRAWSMGLSVTKRPCGSCSASASPILRCLHRRGGHSATTTVHGAPG